MPSIVEWGEGIWTIDKPHRTMGIELGTRTTIVRLPTGGIVFLSPGPLSRDDFRAIDELGRVEGLVAPNVFHHLYLRRAHERFPEAAVFLAPGLREKVPDLPPGEALSDEAPKLWAGSLEQLLVKGTSTREVVFFHPPSRTLVLTDLAFNVREGGLFTRIALRLNGGWDRFGPTRVLRSSIHDPAAFDASIRRIAAWDFDHIVVAHGKVVETGGRAAFRRAFNLEDEVPVPPPRGGEFASRTEDSPA